MLDGALRAASNKHKTIPLTPEEATAASRTFIDSLRSDYDFRARNAAENRERQQAEEKRREEQKKEQQKWNRGVNILIYAIIVIAIGSKLWVWIRKERELEQGVSPTEFEDVTPPVDTVRRDALRAAAEARRRLSEAEEQVRAAEEDWNFACAQFGSAAAEEYGRRLEAAKAAIARGFDTYKQIEHTPDSHAKRRLATTITEALDEDPLASERSRFEGHHTHQPSTCGTRATIEEVDADSPPHDADSHDHVTHASTQGIGSPRTYFHPHTTITYTGLTQPACDTRYTIIETLHSTMVYINLFTTHQGGSHATDSGNSSSYALWKPGRMPRSIRFAMGGATRETRTQHHGRPLPHTH